MNYSFTKAQRLRTRRDFLSMKRGKKTFVSPSYCQCLAIDWHLTQTSSSVRLGITVTKKFGSSVERNRLKRLVRESFRQSSISCLSLGLDLHIRFRGEKGRERSKEITFDSISHLFSDFERYIKSVVRRRCNKLPESG